MMIKHAAAIAAVALVLTAAAQAAPVNAYWSFNSDGDVTAVTDGSVWATTNPTLSTTFGGDGEYLLKSAHHSMPQFTAFDGVTYDADDDGLFQLDNRNGDINSNGATMTAPTILIDLDMTGLSDLTFRADIRPSALGGVPADETTAIDYNVGGGWISTGLSITGLTVGSPNVVMLDFSDVTAIENQSGVQLRVVFEDMTTASDDLAKLEFDNVQLEAVPEPATLALLGLGAIGMIRRRRQA
jgi:hypothetical protein